MSRYNPNKQFRETPPSLPPLYQPAVAAGNPNVTDRVPHTGYDPWAESRGCAEQVESDSGEYTPPPSWTEIHWPGTPAPALQPVVQDNAIEPFSPPAYEDAAIAQRLVEETLIERFAETDPDFVWGRSDSRAPIIEKPISIDSIASNHADPAHTRESLPDLEQSEIGQPISFSPLEAILEEEHPPALLDPIGLLAFDGFYGPGPCG